MKFDELVYSLVEKFNITSPVFDQMIDKMIGDPEERYIAPEILTTKENFWKAYHIANQIENVNLEDWENYQREVIHGYLTEYMDKKPSEIAQDFLLYQKELNKPGEGDYGYQGHTSASGNEQF